MYAFRVSRRYAVSDDEASTLAAYLREIAKLPRLTVDEERSLGARIQSDRNQAGHEARETHRGAAGPGSTKSPKSPGSPGINDAHAAHEAHEARAPDHAG